MSRVATIPLQNTMALAMQRSQDKLAITQQQLATGKKAADFADLGTETVRNLSAHSMLANQKAQSTVSKRVETSLSLYQGHLEGIEKAVTEMREQILSTIGTGKSAGLQETIESAFSQFRNSLNAAEGGTPLFAGSQTDTAPFVPSSLADAATTAASDAFKNDDVRSVARVADGVDVTYGITASDVGKDLYEVFRTLGQTGTIGSEPTAAQLEDLQKAISQLDTGLDSIRSVNADNGRKQNQVETLTTRGEQRSLLLQGVIESNEDADLGQVALDLALHMTTLKASYSVFSQLAPLSLVSYVR